MGAARRAHERRQAGDGRDGEGVIHRADSRTGGRAEPAATKSCNRRPSARCVDDRQGICRFSNACQLRFIRLKRQLMTGRTQRCPRPDPPIDARFLSQLREHVAAREIERGIACLRSHQDLIAKLDPPRGMPAAYWRSSRYGPISDSAGLHSEIFCNALNMKRIALEACDRRLHLPAHGRGDDGDGGRGDGACDRSFRFCAQPAEELDDRFLLAIVFFWKGRCLRRRGEYDEALIYTGKGKDLALALGHPRMAAVMQVLEGWLLFQQGKWKEAVRISQAAERVLARYRRLCDAGQHSVVSTAGWRAGKAVSTRRLNFLRARSDIMASAIRSIRTWRDHWPIWRSPSAASRCSCRKGLTGMFSAGGRHQQPPEGRPEDRTSRQIPPSTTSPSAHAVAPRSAGAP